MCTWHDSRFKVWIIQNKKLGKTWSHFFYFFSEFFFVVGATSLRALMCCDRSITLHGCWAFTLKEGVPTALMQSWFLYPWLVADVFFGEDVSRVSTRKSHIKKDWASVCLFACLSGRLVVCMFVRLSLPLFVYSSIHVRYYRFVNEFIHLSILKNFQNSLKTA